MEFPDPIEIAAAFVLGAALVFGAVISGNQAELCAAIGGTYDRGAPDVCPDGQWRELIGLTR